MTTILFYDTETTGLPNFREQAENHKAHGGVVQLAAVLAENGVVRGAIDLIIKQPEHIEVHPKALEIHGIGRKEMDAYGVLPVVAIDSFMSLLEKADKLCAHNQRFDQKMMRIEMHRLQRKQAADNMRNFPVDCTMKMANDIMKKPPTDKMLAAGMIWSKNPKLEEAYEYFMGEKMTGAHNAWDDVMAMMKVHSAITAK